MTSQSSVAERGQDVAFEIRLRTEADDPQIVVIRNSARPWLPPISVEEYAWSADPANNSEDDITERWVADRDGEILGLVVITKAMFVARENTFHGNVGVALGWRNKGVGAKLYERLMARAKDFGATRMYGQVSEDSKESMAFVEARGFTQTGRAQRLSRLEVETANLDGYEGIVEHVAEGGIEIKTLAELGMEDEGLLHRIHEMSFEAARDIPSTEEFSEIPYDLWRKWIVSPGNGPDKHWLAMDGDEPAGTAILGLRGDDSAFNNYTGVARAYRGRGIARALKFTTVEFAKANGIKTIFTANDYENKPMLSINIPMGYVEVPAEREVVKDL